MRRWLLNFHLYGGLLCAPYLVIFGISSLHFNHRFAFMEPEPETVTWRQQVQVPTNRDNDTEAQSVRDALGLIGWTVPWRMSRTRQGDLEFDLERPGKSYTIRCRAKEGGVRVEERRKGFWSVFNSLHALMGVPNSRLASVWGGYTYLCTGFVLFAGISGVYLWVNSARERRLGWLALIAAAAGSVAFMLYVVMRG